MITIDGKAWLRGRAATSHLLHTETSGSILGLYGLAIGIRTTSLLGRRLASDVPRPFPPAWTPFVQRRRDAFPRRLVIRRSFSGQVVEPPALYPPADYRTSPYWAEPIETHLAEVIRIIEADPFTTDAYKLQRINELTTSIGVDFNIGGI